MFKIKNCSNCQHHLHDTCADHQSYVCDEHASYMTTTQTTNIYIICNIYGDVVTNLKTTAKYIDDALCSGVKPFITPALQFIEQPACVEDQMIDYKRESIKNCDAAWVFGTVEENMLDQITFAKSQGKPIYYVTQNEVYPTAPIIFDIIRNANIEGDNSGIVHIAYDNNFKTIAILNSKRLVRHLYDLSEVDDSEITFMRKNLMSQQYRVIFDEGLPQPTTEDKPETIDDLYQWIKNEIDQNINELSESQAQLSLIDTDDEPDHYDNIWRERDNLDSQQTLLYMICHRLQKIIEQKSQKESEPTCLKN